MKKYLSGILASTMLLSSLSMVTLATETPKNTDNTQETAVYTQTLSTSESDFTMGAGGVITGYTGGGGAVEIPATIGGQTVTSIGAGAFQNVTSLESVTMPSTLTRIEEYAFSGTWNLRSVELNDGLSYIGSYAFEKTPKLGAIWFPSSVTTLSTAAFYQSGLTSLYVPATVTSMGNAVFQDCQYMKEAIFMAKMSKVPNATFCFCSALEEVYLGEGIQIIGDNSFKSCMAMKEISIPSTLTAIGKDAFWACAKLTKLDFSNTKLTTVDTGAFLGCLNLTEAIFPYGFQSFAYGETYLDEEMAPFYSCYSLVKVVLPSTVNDCYFQYNIPNYSVGVVLNTLTDNFQILNHPFIDCNPALVVENYGSATVEKMATYTNDFAISNLTGENTSGSTTPTTAPTLPTKGDMVVQEVTPIPTPNASAESDFVLGEGGMITSYTGTGGDVAIPSTIGGKPVYTIGASVFQNNTTVTSVTMPNTLERIGEKAFDGCSNLQSVQFNEGLKMIYSNAFARTTSLREIWIPSTVTEIQERAFGESGLTSAYIPETVRSPGNYLFEDCTSLSSVIFMADIRALFVGTFRGCTALEEVYLREGITVIGANSFEGCSALKQITLPTTTTYISQAAFYGCTSLEKMDLTNTRISAVEQYAFQYCSSLTEVIFPYGLKKLFYGETSEDDEKAQFLGCTSLTKVVLPSSLIDCYHYRDLTVMEIFNHPFNNTNSSLVIHGYPNTMAEALANQSEDLTFFSLGDVSTENQKPTYTPLAVPTLPTAPVIAEAEVPVTPEESDQEANANTEETSEDTSSDRETTTASTAQDSDSALQPWMIGVAAAAVGVLAGWGLSKKKK